MVLQTSVLFPHRAAGKPNLHTSSALWHQGALVFPLRDLDFQGRRRKGCLWMDCDPGKISPEIQHVRDTEDRKLQLRWSEKGKAKALRKGCLAKGETGNLFDEDVPFQALACRLGRLPGIQYTIKVLPELGTGHKAMSSELI